MIKGMTKIKIITLIIVAILLAIGGVFLIKKSKISKNTANTSSTTQSTNSNQTLSTNQSANTPQSTNLLAEPILQFKERITKKPFGIYVTPQNSSVQPERFQGYHTGTDVEYGDVTVDVPVYAISDGEITVARLASGYGGVIMERFDYNGKTLEALYGHIRPSSLPQVSEKVSKGQQIGVLGTAYSNETDGERRHLHFAILANDRIDLSGYVSSKDQLSDWIDPLTLYPN